MQIWDDIKALFDAMVLRDGLEVLKAEAMAEVRAAAANIVLNPHLAKAFKGGAPEVSMFWVDEDGVPCKARYDYVKPRTIVNLKKFANSREKWRANANVLSLIIIPLIAIYVSVKVFLGHP